MRAKEYLNRSIVVLGTPLSILTALASIPLLLPITLPLLFLALVITLLLVLLALLVILLIVLVMLLARLPQLLQPTTQNNAEQPSTQNKVEQPESKLHRHIRDSSTSTYSSRRRPMLHAPSTEYSHHRTGSCHESEADTLVHAPVYDFTTNGTSFGIDSPRKRH
jgi:cytoskeletal protein RodZ